MNCVTHRSTARSIIRLNPFHIRGVTLIELMVALVISGILALGIVQIFATNKRAFQLNDTASGMQENGRFAYGVLMQDLRRAGHFGGNSNISQITGTTGIIVPANTCPTDNTWARMVQWRTVGLNDTRTNGAGVAYACIPATDYLRGDILALRYTAGNEITAVTMAANANSLYLRSSLFEGRLFTGTNNANVANNTSGTFEKNQALIAHAYYVGPSGRNCSFNDSAGNTIPVPALFREILDASGVPTQEEVASGIEHLQLQYGVDTNDDQNIDQYFNANNITDDLVTTPNWTQVVAVRFWILARAECPTNGYTNTNTYTMGDLTYDPNPDDGFKRQVYSGTVALRN